MKLKTKIKKLREARKLLNKAVNLMLQVEKSNGMTGITTLYSEVLHADCAIGEDIANTEIDYEEEK